MALSGDEIRATWFKGHSGGYDVSQIDALLSRVAAEVDAGRSPAALIEQAAFGRPNRLGYDIEAVDWLLGHLRRLRTNSDLDGVSADPWRDLGLVAQLSTASRPQRAATRWKRLWEPSDDWGMNLEELAGAWERFSDLPGVRLRCKLGFSGFIRGGVTPEEHQALATWRGYLGGLADPSDRLFGARVAVHGQRYRRRRVNPIDPAYAELAARCAQDEAGQYADATVIRRGRPRRGYLRAFLDPDAAPVLYVTGENFHQRAWARITFADQRSLRFLVRGTTTGNAIMTAVDESGADVARYRNIKPRPRAWDETFDITVNPLWPLTDELVLALAVSAQFLGSYFAAPGGGG